MAKLAGEGTNWKETQALFWNGVEYPRVSAEYQQLLVRLYTTVFAQDESFRRNLAKVKRHQLTHSIGSADPQNTILTEEEFIAMLKMLCDEFLQG